MQDQPESTDLLAVVAEFMRQDVVPQLTGSTQYQARVAVHVVERACRELRQPAALAAEENQRLTYLLGQSGSTLELTRTLCTRIADGDIDLDTPGASEYLWFVTLNKLAVDQPGYAGYRRAREQWVAEKQQDR